MKSAIRWLVIVVMLVAAYFCISGVFMVASFSATAPPELLPQYRLRANQWLAAAAMFLAIAVWQGVGLWRDRSRGARGG